MYMANNLVISIGRQFGSGGREIGKGVAEKLGIAFYDKEILAQSAKDSGIVQEIFESMDEKRTPSLLYNLSMGAGYANPVFYAAMDDAVPTSDKLFRWQAATIEKFAAAGPCVIIGRCADYILRDHPGLVSIFIYSDMDKRCQRISRLYNLREDAANVLIRKTDKSRASYYNFSTDREWGNMGNYDLCLNSGTLGVEKSIDLICDYIGRLRG